MMGKIKILNIIDILIILECHRVIKNKRTDTAAAPNSTIMPQDDKNDKMVDRMLSRKSGVRNSAKAQTSRPAGDIISRQFTPSASQAVTTAAQRRISNLTAKFYIEPSKKLPVLDVCRLLICFWTLILLPLTRTNITFFCSFFILIYILSSSSSLSSSSLSSSSLSYIFFYCHLHTCNSTRSSLDPQFFHLSFGR